MAGITNPKKKPIQVRPGKKNVAARKGRARGGKLSIFAHLTLIIQSESGYQSRREPMQVIHERCADARCA
jgi:hypothetical protein